MRIYLAGENGKLKILSALRGGSDAVERYIDEGVLGRAVKLRQYDKGSKADGYRGGIPNIENNADISCRDGLVDIPRSIYRGGWHP